MSTTVSSRRPVLALCLLLALLPSLRLAAASELGAATPQELIVRLAAAAESEDFGELAACVAPDDRAALTMMLLVGAGMMAAFAQMGVGMAESMAEGMAEAFGAETEPGEAAEPTAEEVAAEKAAAAERAAAAEKAAAVVRGYEELLERHGVAELMEQDPNPEATGPEAAAALFAGIDQPALIRDLFTFMKTAFPEEAAAEPMPIQITTTELTDLVIDGDTAHGRVGEEEVDMVRVDGRWFLDLPSEPEAPPGEEAAEPEA